MTRSIRLSQLMIRFGLAVFFFWVGVDKFFDPAGIQLVYFAGVFEVLVGLSFVTGVFLRVFALVGILLLAVNAVSSGLSINTARDVGLAGGLLALTLWPERM